MKNNLTEEDFLLWSDDELEGERLEKVNAHLGGNPALRGDLENFAVVGEALREEIPSVQEPPYRDFFNTRVMRAVHDERSSRVSAAEARPSLFAKLRWLSLPLTAGALALAFAAGMKMAPESSDAVTFASPQEEAPSVYLPSANMKANVVTGSDHEVSLIVMDGLQAIPDDVDFSVGARKEKQDGTYVSFQDTDDLL